MDNQIQRLRERFAQMEDDQLLEIVSKHASDYRPEAIDAAREEIGKRGLDAARPAQTPAAQPAAARVRWDAEEDFEPGDGTEELEEDAEESEEAEHTETVQSDWITCAVCQGTLRSAILLGEHPIIAVFDDNREARYVRLLVCPRCGSASMSVDMRTEVTE